MLVTINHGSSAHLSTELYPVRAALGVSFKSFLDSKSDDIPTDAFEGGLFVYYKPPGICEAIEATEPAVPIFMSRTILGQPFKEICDWFEEMDPGLKVSNDGFTSEKFGIGVFTSDPEESTESVIVFEEGYYSRL
jgi:hypothetical protein